MNRCQIKIVLPNLCGGGAERLHVSLANDWADLGYDVEFILLRKEGDLISLLSPKISVIALSVNRIRNAIIPLSSYLRASRPHVVLVAMWPLTSAVVISWVLSGRRGKLFLSEHEILRSSYILQAKVRLSYLKYLIRFTYSLATGVIAVSRAVKNDLCDLGNLSERTVQVIYNPAATGKPLLKEVIHDQRQLWGTDSAFHILSVGRLASEKDQETMIRAFALVSYKVDAKLVILGEGPLRSDLEMLICNLNLKGKVLLPGFVINPYPWYQSADLFVLTSLWEGFGNVIVEAMECGLPIVCTDCPGGPKEILEYGRLGRLVPIKDVSGLAIAIHDSLNSAHDSEALIRRSKDFTIKKISNEYLTYFSS